MATLTRYVVSKDPSDWGDGPVYDKYADAKRAADAEGACIIELEYEYSDSFLVYDARPEEESVDG